MCCVHILYLLEFQFYHFDDNIYEKETKSNANTKSIKQTIQDSL